MGKGQRHSKNAGIMGSEGLSYAERRAMGLGTVKERFGKDTLGKFYECGLTLQPAVDPVVTPHGHLFSKEAILQNLLAQKKAIRKKMAAWEAAQEGKAKKASDAQAVQASAQLVAFDRANHMGISQKTADAIKGAIVESAAAALGPQTVSNVMVIKEQEERAKTSKSFWMPTLKEDAEAKVDKPDPDTVCPASGKKLRMKDLVDVKFTMVPNASESEGRYIDPVTKDTFTASHKLVVLVPTGDVVMKETYEKVLKPDGEWKGHKLRERDVIELKTGGTGFVGRDGDRVMAEKRFIGGMGSGRQDLRGQHNQGTSLGGLVFTN
mmetsp:Transcript_5486/g.9493  ORF Transcript_5486/g.9493 Transcript_5486/m.9493 type:complete len:322 (-) Transcript_5486:741-1706(-)|eukprot:CAMPEP_0119103160 /NCGR_PEP_ID=MMETSP1180-20130426/1681_1 /TAXON_ID=3052 ORGANISM="Chlamydomonas cf sp, Strain CCMP681" /NCGR_SAMPLE_ID=MMETSP1180 /ASSEMBLY_ACC=CAM_ASM_000741 /LENGTH=321 /DNA_ID=CAMNT_0007087605 /DNA_START=66 /DNA_END=1031 /DNA_ORIENTATION=-